MQGSLWALGLVIAAAGFVAIGFGIPINAFSLGNTLIMAGTTAVVGGFVLIGLAAVVRQLKRIADAGLQTADAAPHAIAPEHHDPRASFLGPQASHGHAMPPPAPPLRPAPPPELKLAPPAPEPSSVEWLRPKDREPTLGERAVIEEFEASLTPQPAPPPAPPIPQAPPPPRPASMTNFPRMPEAKAWPPAPAAEPPLAQSAPPPMPPRSEPVARPQPATSGLFDSVWPELRPSRSAETVERVRKVEPNALPAREEPRTLKPQAAPAEEQRPAAILKSGMIDGMAYTLFADGSIEAVLPSGTLRFASVDALRLHLEKNG